MNNFFDKNKLTALSFYLLMVILPFKLILFPIALFILLLTFVFLKNKKNIIKNITKKQGIILLIALFFIYFFGLFFPNNQGLNYSKISIQLPILIIPIIFTGLNLNLDHINKAKRIFVLACVCFCLISLISLLFNYFVNFEHRLNYNFIQRSMYHFHFPYDVLYLNVAAAILLFDSFLKKYRTYIGILFFSFIVLSGVRIGIFSFGIIIFFYILLKIKTFLNVKSFFKLSAILIFGFFLIKSSKYANDKFFDTLNKIGLNTSNYVSDIGEGYHNLNLRQKLWESSLVGIKQNKNLLIGYGTKGSRQQLNDIYNAEGYSELKNFNSHNQYLTTLLNNGVLGLLLLISIFSFSLFQSYSLKSFSNLLIVLVIVIAFFTESMLERQKGVVIFSVFLTLATLGNILENKDSKI